MVIFFVILEDRKAILSNSYSKYVGLEVLNVCFAPLDLESSSARSSQLAGRLLDVVFSAHGQIHLGLCVRKPNSCAMWMPDWKKTKMDFLWVL